MKMYYFSAGNDEDTEFCVTAGSIEDAIAELDTHLSEFEGSKDISYWRENPELVKEFEIGQVVGIK